MKSAQLKNPVGGRIGVALEYVFRPMNFDWRTNIALLGGFAAKEVVVRTLGKAYDHGKLDAEESDSLAERLSSHPKWNALHAIQPHRVRDAVCALFRDLGGDEAGDRFLEVARICHGLFHTVLAYVVVATVSSVGFFLGLGVQTVDFFI